MKKKNVSKNELHSSSVEFYRKRLCTTLLVSSVMEQRVKKDARYTCKQAFMAYIKVSRQIIITWGLIRLKIVELNFLRCSGRRNASLVYEFCTPANSERRDDRLIGKKAFELCKRVFTTSNGHVTTAPAVPATLKN